MVGQPKIKTHTTNQTTMNKALKVNWKQQPWKSQSDKPIAEKLGCSQSTVRHKRSVHAPGTIEARGSKFKFDKLTDADWSKPNEDIAAKLGCSKTLVALHRAQLGKPFAERRSGGGRKVTLDYSKYDPSLTAAVNAQNLGCSVNYITVLKQKLANQQPAKPEVQPEPAKKAAKIGKKVAADTSDLIKDLV
jgi:biotin operon repressor